MKIRLPHCPAPGRTRSGVALIVTLILLALCAVVIVSMLFLTQTDRIIGRNTAEIERARGFAQAGLNMATGLISANSRDNAYVTYQVIVPPTGVPTTTAYTGPNGRIETRIAQLEAQGDRFWELRPRAPVTLHSGFAAAGEGVDLNFATREDPNVGYIVPRTNLPNSGWQNLTPDSFRMKWVNIYKDNDSSKPENLIGRFAFWVDDESSKFNLNHSGWHMLYRSNPPHDYSATNSSEFNNALPKSVLDWEMNASTVDMRLYPWYQDFSAVRGLSRTDAYHFLRNRQAPWMGTDPLANPRFRPLSSPLGVRYLSVENNPNPPALGTGTPPNDAISGLMKQSEMLFTATVYSSELERTARDGKLRANLFDASILGTPELRKAWFVEKLEDLFPEFGQKYDLHHFAAGAADFIDNDRTEPPLKAVASAGDKADGLAKPTPYTSAGSTSFSAETGPRLNEVVFQVYGTIVGNELTIRNVMSLEFINLYRLTPYLRYAAQATSGVQGEVYPIGVEIPSGLPPLIIQKGDSQQTVEFADPPNRRIDSMTHLDPAYPAFLKSSPMEANFSDSTCILTYQQSTKVTLPPGGDDISLFRPQSSVEGGGPLQLKVVIRRGSWSQSAQSTLPSWGRTYGTDGAGGEAWSVTHQNTSGEKLLLEYSLEPEVKYGINGDPRIGIFSDVATTESVASGSTYAQNKHNLGKVNQAVFKPFDSPAIAGGGDNMRGTFRVPGEGVDQADGGYGVSDGWRLGYYQMPAMLGDVPVYRFDSPNHLAWSTPRLWGSGRTSFAGGTHPPDWWLLDVFSSNWYSGPGDEENISYGKININSLKSYYNPLPNNQDAGTNGGKLYKQTAASIFDSLFHQIKFRDFHIYPSGQSSQLIEEPDNRRAIVHRLLEEVMAKNARDEPLATAAEALAYIASEDFTPVNPPGTYQAGNRIGQWYYPPPEDERGTGNNDRRVEGIVRALNNRVTTKGNQFTVYAIGQSLQVPKGGGAPKVVGETYVHSIYERAPEHSADGSVVNGTPMRQLFYREVRY